MRFCVIFMLLSLPVHLACAFDTEKASTERFKVSYVEPEQLPPLTVVPKRFFALTSKVTEADRAKGLSKHYYLTRVHALQREQKEISDSVRRSYLRGWHFAIKVVDTKTKIVYRVHTDRRTISATDGQGKLLWKVDPFVDARLKPYRFAHPIITYFGASSALELQGEGTTFLSIAFSSSQFGRLALDTGEFEFGGND